VAFGSVKIPQCNSLQQWQQLKPDQKSVLIEELIWNNEDIKYKYFKVIEYEISDLNNKKSSQLKLTAQDIEEISLSMAETDNIADDISSIKGIFSIGNPYLKWVTFIYLNNTLIAAQASLIQNGGAMVVGSKSSLKSHFLNINEAKKYQGLNLDADVSWQMSSYLEYDFLVKKWRVLINDINDEGGFRWSGW